MSRSVRKPIFTDQQNDRTKKVKRRATRAVRAVKLENSPAFGAAYKKEFQSWDICDWTFFSPNHKKSRRK